ncbi:MAG: hypothetical protein QGF46_03660 [Planctomycetota bacterium]|nr:hypothetical protein [Planctomycetota bacterium]
MDNTLPSLIKAQEFDKRIVVLSRRLSSLPGEVGERESELLALKADYDDADAENKACLIKADSLEVEVAGREERIAKLDRTATETVDVSIAKVAQHEAQELREKNNVDQEQALMLLDKSDELKARLKKMAPQIEQADADLESFRQTVANDSADFQAELDSLLQQRQVTLSAANTAVVKAFDTISERHPGGAISPLRGDSCGGCGTRLVPNDCMRVETMKSPVRCPSCTRFLVPQEFFSVHSS